MPTWLTNNLSTNNYNRLFIALPVALDEDSDAVEYCIAKLGIREINDRNFEDVFEQVKNMMYEEFPPAPPRGGWL